MFTRYRVAIAAAFLLYSTIAAAHPALLSSTPKAGETLDATPSQLRLTFNEAVEAGFTTVKIVDAGDKEVLASKVQLDPKDANSVTVPLTTLPTGAYHALWSAVGHDGHRVKGEFRFTVK